MYVPFTQRCTVVVLQPQKLTDKGGHGPDVQITSVSSSGLPSLLHLGLSKQPHPISGAPTPAITLLYLKQSSLFKIKGRNMDHLFSFAFLPPLEGATRAHL